MQIKRIESSPTRWHRLVVNRDDTTEAMNIHGGVLVRTTAQTIQLFRESSPSTSLTFIPGLVVAQRWEVELVKADPCEGREAFIGLARVVLLSTPLMIHDEGNRSRGMMLEASGSKPARFRLFSADETMPTPPDEIVRAIAENRRPPTEVEALRAELEAARQELTDIELAVADHDPLAGPEDLAGRLRELLGQQGDRRKLLVLREDVQSWTNNYAMQGEDELHRLTRDFGQRLTAIIDANPSEGSDGE